MEKSSFLYQIYKNLFCGFYLFISLTLTKHCTAGEEKGYCCSSYPALPPTSYVIRHKLKDYCRELVFAYSQQSGSRWCPWMSECKSLATQLHPLDKHPLNKQLSMKLILLMKVKLQMNLRLSLQTLRVIGLVKFQMLQQPSNPT